MALESGSRQAPLQITEDEAAVYDRQIRLWGLEAQQKMRNATILVVNLRGVATEIIKNIVLAGIGKLLVVDDQDVSEEDLGAGFFFTDDDVGKKRVDAAKHRIENLNPLVSVETIPSFSVLDDDQLEKTLHAVDMVCVTDSDRETLIRVNDACRQCQKPFYAGGSYGLLGFIFCDLISHEYLTPDHAEVKGGERKGKTTLTYSPLKTALKPYSWSSLSRIQTKDLNPAIVFTILALWEFQSRHGGMLPNDDTHAPELESIASALFSAADVNKRVIKSMPANILQHVAMTATCEISAVCAVIGGVLGQDMLKTLAAREPPIANFFVFDGNTGHGSVCRMNM